MDTSFQTSDKILVEFDKLFKSRPGHVKGRENLRKKVLLLDGTAKFLHVAGINLFHRNKLCGFIIITVSFKRKKICVVTIL